MNNDAPRIVAVDVGNTAVKIALGPDSSLKIGRFDPTEKDWQCDAIDFVRRIFGDDLGSIEWRIATVNQAAADQLRQSIGRVSPTDLIRSIKASDVPLELDVDNPDRVGIDRLLSAHATWARFKSAAVVIDAGSAVTVDWVEAGRFCGGSIFPGLELQARALGSGTDALPQVELGVCESIPLPGRNTSEAIVAGIILGTASSIDGLVNRYTTVLKRTTADFMVIITGGDAFALSPHIQTPHRLIPELVCDGLLRLPKR